MSKLKEGSEMSKLKEGLKMSIIKEGLEMSKIKEGLKMSKIKEGLEMSRMNRRMLGVMLLGILMLAVVAVPGCPPQQEAAQEETLQPDVAAEFPVTIVDATGKEITIDSPVERIVIFNNEAAEAVRILGAADRVVGVASWVAENARFYPEIDKLPTVGEWHEPNVEAILALNPDVVLFMGGRFPDRGNLKEKLQDTGIAFIRLAFNEVETLREEMLKLGKILALEAEANDYVAWHDAVLNPIKEKVAAIPEEERARVFIDTSMPGGREVGRLTSGSGTRHHSLIVAAGGINIAEGYVERWGDVEIEWILQENPEVIIAKDCELEGYKAADDTELREYYNIIHELPGFTKLKAVQEGRVHIITNAIAVGPPFPVATATIAQWLYPDKFADLDPQAIHQEYIDRFSPGVDFDVRTQGVFVYPPFGK